MSLGEVPTTAAPRARTLGPVLVIVLGYLVLVLAMRFAAEAPQAVAGGPPTCDGEVMAVADVCEETRREFVTRTGRVNWYQDIEVTSTYDEMVEAQDRDAALGVWLRAMLIGIAGVVVVFVGIRWLVTGRTRRRARSLVSFALLPLLAAVVFVGWAESRFDADERPGVFVWWLPEFSAAAVAMLGFVAMGTAATVSGARYADEDAAQGGPAFAGHEMAGWWERVLARLIDTLVVAVAIGVVSIIVAILAFAVGRPLLGDETAGIVMNVVTLVLAVLIALGYDAQISDEKGDGTTVGKKAMKLRVLSRAGVAAGSQIVPEGAAFVRALTWWTPIFAVAVLASDAGPVGPVPYAYMLFVVPVLNGLWPLCDRRARQSLNDRAAGTVVVRVRES